MHPIERDGNFALFLKYSQLEHFVTLLDKREACVDAQKMYSKISHSDSSIETQKWRILIFEIIQGLYIYIHPSAPSLPPSTTITRTVFTLSIICAWKNQRNTLVSVMRYDIVYSCLLPLPMLNHSFMLNCRLLKVSSLLSKLNHTPAFTFSLIF